MTAKPYDLSIIHEDPGIPKAWGHICVKFPLDLLQWPDFRLSIWIQTRSLYPGYAAPALPTMDGGPQCRT